MPLLDAKLKVTHKSGHEAGVAHVALKCYSLCNSSGHDGGCSSAERPMEEEHMPTAVIPSGGRCFAEGKITIAYEGV